MIIALHSSRARQRVTALLQREIGWAWPWYTWAAARAGFAEVTASEYERVKHLPGVSVARDPRPVPRQLPLL